MINVLISAILQVAVFTAIPFLVYLIKYRTRKGFLAWIGLKRSTRKANLLALLVTIVLVVPLLAVIFASADFQAVMTDPKSVTGSIREMDGGLVAVLTILIAAVFKTALAEEIFFRGFVAKRLIAVTSFQTGNILQAVLFGILHTLLFMLVTDQILFLIVIFVFPTIGAYLKTYLNEKLAGGSIIPGWIAHGAANVISYSAVVFVL